MSRPKIAVGETKKSVYMTKKAKSYSCCWSQLPIELYELIFRKLVPKDILRFKAVCPWSKAVVEFVLKSSSFSCLPEPPCVFLSVPYINFDGGDGFPCLSLQVQGRSNIEYNLKNGDNDIPSFRDLRSHCRLGSSQGYLLLMNQYENQNQLLLVNPFKGTQLALGAPLDTFPDIDHTLLDNNPALREVLATRYIYKVVVLLLDQRLPTTTHSSSSHDCDDIRSSNFYDNNNNNNIGVMIMYNMKYSRNPFEHNLAFCTVADDKWTKLNNALYIDAMSYHHDTTLYALRCDSCVEIWDFPVADSSSSFIPFKKMEIRADASMVDPYDRNLNSVINPLPNCRRYIIKTLEDVLMVVALQEYDDYKRNSWTTAFKVYKLRIDFDSQSNTGKWVKVDSLGNHVHALALGANESIVISELHHVNKNSIYFTNQSSLDLPYYLGEFDVSNHKAVETQLCELQCGDYSHQPVVLWVDPRPFQF